jgi:hypothetical protein
MQDRTLSDAVEAYAGQPGKLDGVSPEQRVATQIGEVKSRGVVFAVDA